MEKMRFNWTIVHNRRYVHSWWYY